LEKIKEFFRRYPFMAIFLILLIVRSLMNGLSMQVLIYKLLSLPGIIIGISVHEYAHAKVSDKLGDPTPRMQGRVTLNPAAHVDPIGLLTLILLGFGWGKPVMIDPRYYRNRRRDEAFVAVAGVATNFITAFVFTAVMRICIAVYPAMRYHIVSEVIFEILQAVVSVNLSLMVFNLIPLPPLDGFNLVTQIFKLDRYRWYPNAQRYGYYILLLLIAFGFVGRIVAPCYTGLYNFLVGIFF
jgi:Zn-dependent protease